MLSSINPISFCGRVTRQTHTKLDRDSREATVVQSTKDEFIRSYDEEIEKIKDYKDFAIKLDNMMYNDPKIQQLIKELPDEMEIEVAGDFVSESSDDGKVIINSPILIASEDPISNTQKYKELDREGRNKVTSLYLEFDKKGPDKQQIIDWLNNLKTFFE